MVDRQSEALVRTAPAPVHLGNLRAALLGALDRQRAAATEAKR